MPDGVRQWEFEGAVNVTHYGSEVEIKIGDADFGDIGDYLEGCEGKHTRVLVEIGTPTPEESDRTEPDPSPTVIEEWTVLDRWWTENPVERQFREVERAGRRLVEKRERRVDEWSEWEEVDAH